MPKSEPILSIKMSFKRIVRSDTKYWCISSAEAYNAHIASEHSLLCLTLMPEDTTAV